MIGTIARLALLRFLPRRLVPLLTAWEVLRVIRGRRSQGSTTPSATSRSRPTRPR